MTIFTLTEAATEVGRSKSTLLRAIDAGRLSATRNEHGDYRVDAAELFRVYPPQSAQQSSGPVAPSDPATTDAVNKLVSQLVAKDEKIDRMEAELADAEQRLAEHREASRALMSPEDFEAKLQVEIQQVKLAQEAKLTAQQAHHEATLNAQQTEQARLAAEQKQMQEQQSEKWKASLAERMQEIDNARQEAEALKQKAAEDIAMVERRAAGERAVREALENRGLIARLLNRKPAIAE